MFEEIKGGKIVKIYIKFLIINKKFKKKLKKSG